MMQILELTKSYTEINHAVFAEYIVLISLCNWGHPKCGKGFFQMIQLQ